MAFAAYMALMTPFVQTRLVDYFTRILEERTGTTISIGRVEFRPIESLILNDVFVRDCRQDTLVFCERLVMKVDSVSFVKRRFTITEAAFEKAKFNLWIERRQDGGESLTNVEQLINSFSSSCRYRAQTFFGVERESDSGNIERLSFPVYRERL